MRYLLAIVMPFLAVILCGKIITGLLLLLLQCTFLGWIPAAIIAYGIVSNHHANKRIARQTRELKRAMH